MRSIMQAFDTEKEPVEICENCGTENSCNAKYCKNCGHKLNKFLNWKKIKRENDLFIKYTLVFIISICVFGIYAFYTEKQPKIKLENAEDDLLAKLREESFGNKVPLAYCCMDLDADHTPEIIVRHYEQEDSNTPGEYVYDIYQYNKKTENYLKLSEATFYSFFAEDMIRYDAANNALVINCTTYEIQYEGYQFRDGTLHIIYETSQDKRDLPVLEFNTIYNR